MADLEEAIRVAQEALNTTQQDHPDRAKLLNNLRSKLGDRYSRTGAITDLEEVIRVTQEAVDATPQDYSDRAGRLSNLGNGFNNRYLRTGAIIDLEEAIRVTQEAVDAIPQDHPDRVICLNNLGVQLGNKYSRTRTMIDLEEAIQVIQEAVDTTPQDHPDRFICLNNLGYQLGDRYSRTGAMVDFEKAIQVTQEAVNATPQGHPNRARLLKNLGDQFGNRYSRTGAMVDLEEAILQHQSALCQLTSSIIDRVVAGRRVLQGYAIISDWQQAYKASDIAIRLIPKLTLRSLENSDRQHMLGQVVGLASNAAAVAFHAEKGPLVALEFLEQGRGVLAASLEEMRTDILDLQERYPELAEKFVSLCDKLDQPVSHNLSFMDESRGPTWQVQADQRYEAGVMLDELIDKIRKKSEFERFLLAPSEREMRDAARCGPIVVINVSMYRCDAMIVEQHEIWSLRLPQPNIEEINEKAQGGNLGNLKVLEWLWDIFMKPILDALGFTQPPPNDNWPHVWWIPTGPLSKFPLHAAGHHLEGSSETVLDRVMSSYSSSIKAIIHGRQRCIIPFTSAQALLVAVKYTGDLALHSATKEVAMLHNWCKSMEFNPVKPGGRKKDVISHLPQCKIFHFAGHGYTDNNDPSKSHLLLEDGKNDPLTIATLLEMNLRKHSPFLAYLSACGTGQIKNERFVNESIHLISACQLAGFRHVIGTLWEVNDELCVEMARLMYTGMGDGGMTDESVCQGLHNATRELRDRWLNEHERGNRNQQDARMPWKIKSPSIEKMYWVPYVHFGV